jgi:hypothetical protein
VNPLLLEGLTDAVGFIGGVLVAYLISKLLGFDPLAEGYGNSSIAGIVLAGVGGGIGLQLARKWRAARKNRNE